MRRLLLLATAPLLLAPIRYQVGDNLIEMPEGQGPSQQALSLPPAQKLATPTVIPAPVVAVAAAPSVTGVSPAAVVSPSVRVSGTASATVPSPVPLKMPETVAAICKQALQTMAELSLLSYEQKRHQSSMNLTIAAAAAAAEAGQSNYPPLNAITAQFQALPYFSPQYKELKSAYQGVMKACRAPEMSKEKPTPGSALPIPRPE